MADLNLYALLPALILVLAAMAVMVADMFNRGEQSPVARILPWLALVGVIASAASVAWLWTQPVASFQDAAVSDHFALGVAGIVLVATAFAILLSVGYVPKVNKQVGEFYALLLLCAAGMTMMGSATDLIVVFLALEIFSLALYILCGLNRESPRSGEASMKYFLLGAFASTFFVYGAALVYGATGSTQYDAIAAMIAAGNADMSLLYIGLALLIAGFGFKVSMVPFHMWTPDVYQGAPTPVTAFMSVGTKVASFAAFMRLLLIALPASQETWGWVLAILAVLTMTLGNLAALRQTSLKRMLAYSSIANAGYLLVALVPGTVQGVNAALFYLFSYAFMNIGAFAIVIVLERAGEDDALQNRAAGLADRWPMMAAAMALFMFGLSGMPPLAGFFGKWLVFGAAIDSGWVWLAAIGMLNAVIGAYYYLRVIVAMYFEQPGETSVTKHHMWGALNFGVVIAAIFTVAIGVYPTIWTALFETGLTGMGG